MNDSLLAVLVGALMGALGGGLVPQLVGRVPELAEDEDPEATAGRTYRALARRPALLPGAVLLGAATGAVLGWGLGWDLRLIGWLLALPALGALGYIDWFTKRLPNALMWPLILLLTPVMAIIQWILDGPVAVGWLLLCAAGSWLFYYLLWLANSSGIGFGDVRLAWVLGLLLGSSGVAQLLSGLWLGFAIGGVGGLLMGGMRGSLKRTIPFGPFMILGAVVGLLCGAWMLSGLVR